MSRQTNTDTAVASTRNPASGQARSGHRVSIPLGANAIYVRGGTHHRGPALRWVAVLLAAVCAISPVWSGFFDFTAWGPLALLLIAILAVIIRSAAPVQTRIGRLAGTGLLVLLALSAASMIWAESKDSAWTSINRLGLYVAIFLVVLLVAPNRRGARVIVVILGASALVTCVGLDGMFLAGAGQGAFLSRRLASPVGYINGTAALLVMGAWPWLAAAEAAARRFQRSLSLSAATLIAGTVVLTQSRAVVPAALVSVAVALICTRGRTRRAANLLLVGIAVAASLHWTLAVYSSGGPAARNLAPGHAVISAAGAALLVCAVAAGLLHQLLSAGIGRLSANQRQALARLAGATMAVGLIVAVVVSIPLYGGKLAAQWRSFASNRVNFSAQVRFADAGGYREDLWRVAFDEFRAHPWGGVGAGNYDAAYYRLRHNPEYVLQPHSLELQMLAELGIPGLVALLVFCGAVLAAGFKRRDTLAAQDRLIRIAALGMFAAWLADTSVDWPYDIPGITGMALIAGALLVLPAVVGARRQGGSRPLLLSVLGLIAVAVLAASIGRQYAAVSYEQAGQAQIARSPARAITTLRLAAQLDPYSMNTLYGLAAAFARRDDYRDARDALLLSAAREPDNYVPPTLLGDLAVRHGDRPLAAAEYAKAVSLNPRDPILRALELQTGGRP